MNRGPTFESVDKFEEALARFTGARHVIAVSTGTAALFLALAYERLQWANPTRAVTCPARTFISVPMQIIHAGFRLKFADIEWSGSYQLTPTRVLDSALRFHRNMYQDGLECISFHARKLLPIGEGGAILTNDRYAAKWLRAARNSGREAPDFNVEDVKMLGWQFYMTPEKAARGLHLLAYVKDSLPDQSADYPDLRKVPVFKEYTK